MDNYRRNLRLALSQQPNLPPDVATAIATAITTSKGAPTSLYQMREIADAIRSAANVLERAGWTR